MRLLSEGDVQRLITRPLALEAADEAFRRHSEGENYPPARADIRASDESYGVLNLVALTRSGLLSVKTNTFSYCPNSGKRRTASLLTLWNAEKSEPMALISSACFNKHRTAAGFAAACRQFARPDAKVLTVFGAGAVAPESMRYMVAVRPIERIIVVSRKLERAVSLAETASQWPEMANISISATSDAAMAAGLADIIVTATTSTEPVFPGECVRPGTFVVLGGANRPTAREADDALITRSTIVADHLNGCMERAGDLAIPLRQGVLRPEQISGEIGEYLAGTRMLPQGRDVTVFKSIGIAMQDLVLGQQLLECAEQGDISKFDFRGSVEELETLAS